MRGEVRRGGLCYIRFRDGVAPVLLRFLLLLMAVPLAAAPPRPNIVLITLDTTRATRMGFLGSKAKLTPNLDTLAKQSTVFTRAFANVPLTTASHATILSGTLPQFHGVNDFGVTLPKRPALPSRTFAGARLPYCGLCRVDRARSRERHGAGI